MHEPAIRDRRFSIQQADRATRRERSTVVQRRSMRGVCRRCSSHEKAAVVAVWYG
jgi:hypothetical protein